MWVLGGQRSKWASHGLTVWGPSGLVEKIFEHYFELKMYLQTQNYHFQLFNNVMGRVKLQIFSNLKVGCPGKTHLEPTFINCSRQIFLNEICFLFYIL